MTSMFHLDDNAVSEIHLNIFQDAALIDETDGFIWFKGTKTKAMRAERHNACEILLSWETAEEYGVQRIRHGSQEPMTRAQWRKRLQSGLQRRRVQERMDDITKVFVGQKLKFKVIGWHILTIKFLKIGPTWRILNPSKPATVIQNGPKDNDSTMAEKINVR